MIDGIPGATTEGQAVPFARIQVDEGTSAVVTDSQGHARLPGLLAGKHDLRVSSERFARFEQVVDLGGDQAVYRTKLSISFKYEAD